jgi:four helix bundle protein
MNHKDLDAWKNAMLLAERIYLVTKTFPTHEQYGMVSQFRRAGVSVPTNIAEGSARNGNKELSQFLRISLGSLAELETLTILAQKIGYFSVDERDELLSIIVHCSKQISGLIKYVNTHESPKRKMGSS